MKKILAGVVVSMVLVGLLSGCSKQANAEASKSSNKSGKKYIIATDATYAPF